VRYRAAGAGDDVSRESGDAGFVGVDMRRHPGMLEPGLAAEATNMVLRHGRAETRKGWQTVGWGGLFATDWPVDWATDVLLLDHPTDPYLTLEMNYRVQAGTTLCLRQINTEFFHAMWLESITDGEPTWAWDSDGMGTLDFVWAPYDPLRASYRVAGGNTTLQLMDRSTELFHTIWVQTVGGEATLAIDPTGMARENKGSDAGGYNYRVVDAETLQLLNPGTGNWHTIWVELVGGEPTLAIDPTGHVGSEPGDAMTWAKQVGLGTLWGVGVFSDPFGREIGLAALQEYALRFGGGMEPEVVRYPPYVQVTAPVELVQAFDRVLMFRGELEEQTPLVWSPRQSFEAGLDAFAEVEQTAARGSDDDNDYGDGTQTIPNAADATLHNNRLYIPVGRDEIVVSDILDYTRYNEATQRFRINAGSSDRIVRILPWNQTTLVIFKDQSVHTLGNVYGNLADIRTDVLTSEFGLVGRDAVAMVGRDIVFLGHGGVYSLQMALDNKLQASADPLSGPMQPLMDRIQWAHAHKAQMAYDDSRLLLAVPMDGADFCNAVLVFDYLTRAWHGRWVHPEMEVTSFLRMNYGGRRRLMAVMGHTKYLRRVHGSVQLLQAGDEDRMWSRRTEIATELMTRGYLMQTLGRKNYGQVLCDISSWAGTFQVYARPEGVNEERDISGTVAKSRTRSYVHGLGPYSALNADGQHEDEWREDYSVAMEPSSLLDVGDGIGTNRFQRAQEVLRARQRGSLMQLRIAGTRGRMMIHGVQVECRPGRQSYLTKA
jgi:hypothetical protein